MVLLLKMRGKRDMLDGFAPRNEGKDMLDGGKTLGI